SEPFPGEQAFGPTGARTAGTRRAVALTSAGFAQRDAVDGPIRTRVVGSGGATARGPARAPAARRALTRGCARRRAIATTRGGHRVASPTAGGGGGRADRAGRAGRAARRTTCTGRVRARSVDPVAAH